MLEFFSFHKRFFFQNCAPSKYMLTIILFEKARLLTEISYDPVEGSGLKKASNNPRKHCSNWWVMVHIQALSFFSNGGNGNPFEWELSYINIRLQWKSVFLMGQLIGFRTTFRTIFGQYLVVSCHTILPPFNQLCSFLDNIWSFLDTLCSFLDKLCSFLDELKPLLDQLWSFLAKKLFLLILRSNYINPYFFQANNQKLQQVLLSTELYCYFVHHILFIVP